MFDTWIHYVGKMRQPENLGLVKILFFYDFTLVTGHGPNCLPSFQNFSFQSCTLRSGFSKYLVNCQDSMPILLADISTTTKKIEVFYNLTVIYAWVVKKPISEAELGIRPFHLSKSHIASWQQRFLPRG